MKYNILINQQELSRTKLDIIDGAILDYIYFFCNSQNKKIKEKRIIDENEEIWTWIDYSTLSKDMPLIKIKETGAIARRITKIENEGYIETRRFKHMKKYFKTTAKYDTLVIQVNKVDDPSDTDQRPYCSISIDPSDTDQSIKNKYNKEKKITLPANAGRKINSTVDEIMNSMKSKNKNSSFGQKENKFDFNFGELLNKMIKEKRKDLQIVGIYWKWLGWSFDNMDQYQSAIKRDIKMSLSLKGYSLERIKRVFRKLDKDSNNGEKFAWNLNTVHKTIDNIK